MRSADQELPNRHFRWVSNLRPVEAEFGLHDRRLGPLPVRGSATVPIYLQGFVLLQQRLGVQVTLRHIALFHDLKF
jgi:hypothetical protein